MAVDKQTLSAKQRFIETLNLRPADRLPVTPHWWGVYKYEATGRDIIKDAWRNGEQIAEVYADFYEKFQPDWFHLHIGTPRYFTGSEIVQRDGRPHLVIDPAYRDQKLEDKYFSVNSGGDEEIVDFPDYLLGSRSFKPKVDLSSKQKIDQFISEYVHMDDRLIRDLGYTDHVRKIAERYGNDVFINVHIPSAICEIFDPITGYTGFEAGLTAFIDFPEGMSYLLQRCYEEQLFWARAFAEAGTHGYTISESYISPDTANPRIYRDFVKGLHRDYFGEIQRMGLIPMCMFWGDINPILEDLTEINIRGLLVEETKKTFDLSISRIRSQVGDRLCVFGNLDSIYLLHDGTPDEISAEVYAQSRGAEDNFVIINGSPITPGTPEENVKALIEAGTIAAS